MENKVRLLTLLLVSGVCSGSTLLVNAAPLPPGPSELQAPVQISNPTTYEIEMKTSFTVPQEGKSIDEVRIWHALPTRKPWSGDDKSVNNLSAAQAFSFSPASGEREQRVDKESDHVVWRQKQGLTPGTELHFTTRYTVHSSARKFDARAVKLQWPVEFTPPDDINPSLAALADKVRAAMSPTEAVQQFCTSIENNIKYDATVDYKSTDVDATVRNHRGHCGHIYNVFQQLCRRVGIPVRSVVGFNLYSADGRGYLSDVRADYCNVHTWAEVFFPGIGWVEVEPSRGNKAFSIPAQYIQNNRWFQNYVLHIFIDKELQSIGWAPQNGRFVSPYRIANLTTFKATKE